MTLRAAGLDQCGQAGASRLPALLLTTVSPRAPWSISARISSVGMPRRRTRRSAPWRRHASATAASGLSMVSIMRHSFMELNSG